MHIFRICCTFCREGKRYNSLFIQNIPVSSVVYYSITIMSFSVLSARYFFDKSQVLQHNFYVVGTFKFHRSNIQVRSVQDKNLRRVLKNLLEFEGRRK